MPCLVQGDVEDLTEVNRVGCPELIGTAQFSDRDTVFQGDACESIVRRDLEKGKYRLVSQLSSLIFPLRVSR
jgi:hypothetical protein